MFLKYAQASYYYYEDCRGWILMANVFLFPPPTPHQHQSLWAVISLGKRGVTLISVFRRLILPWLNVIQSMLLLVSLSSVDSVHSVQCTICRYIAQRHWGINNPVFTVSTQAINLGWILREASISQMNEAQSCFCRAVDLLGNFLFGYYLFRCMLVPLGTLFCGTNQMKQNCFNIVKQVHLFYFPVGDQPGSQFRVYLWWKWWWKWC